MKDIKTIQLSEHIFEYELRTHPRAKRTSLTIYPDARLAVTIPPRATILAAERLLRHKSDWVIQNMLELRNTTRITLPKIPKAALPLYKNRALALITRRVEFLNNHYRLNFNRITIRAPKSQWGSCSAKKNLNFNFLLMFLPIHLVDYVIVHELCHLREFNHSRSFWELVAEKIPNYPDCEEELNHYIIS